MSMGFARHEVYRQDRTDDCGVFALMPFLIYTGSSGLRSATVSQPIEFFSIGHIERSRLRLVLDLPVSIKLSAIANSGLN